VSGPSGGVSAVSCSGDACAVTLGGAGSTAEVFGTTVVLEELRGRVATLSVGGRRLSVRAGQSLTAGRTRLRCTSVSAGTVALTVVRT
jgi:hypothetical protein